MKLRSLLNIRLLMPLVLLTKTNTIMNIRLKRSQQRRAKRVKRRKRMRVKPPTRKASPQDTSIWLWSTLAAPETKLLEH